MNRATTTPTTKPEPAELRARSPFGEILAIARAAPSRNAYYRQTLSVIGQFFQSPYATIYLRQAAEVVEEEYHSGPTDPGFWKPAVHQLLVDGLAENRPRAKLMAARNAQLRVALISIPFYSPQGAPIGALALVTRITGEDAHAQVSLLQSLVALVSYAAGFVGQAATSAGSTSAAPNQALARAAGMESVEQLAFSLTNSLRNKLGCEQVALAMVAGRRVRLISISGLDQIKLRSPGVVRLRAAMEECLDAGEPIHCDRDSLAEAGAKHYRLHKQWHDATHGAAVASIPLYVDERVVAIISLRRSADHPFEPDQIEQLRKVVEPFAAPLLLVHDARRSVARHIADNVRSYVHQLASPGHIARKVTAAITVVAAVWFLFGTMGYAVSAPARIAPADGRQVAMPFDGVLLEALVVPGDRVHAGDVLCKLDTRDMELKRAELLAQQAVVRQQQLSGLASDQPVQARIAAAQLRLVQAQLAQVQRRIDRATVRSPIDGIVVNGDLRQRAGSVLPIGEALFEIAPADSLRLEIDVPESSVAGLDAGLPGRFAPFARPEEAVAFSVRRIRPTSELRDDQNVYVIEADAAFDTSWVRPGMEGVAKIDAGARPVWWVVLHKIIDHMRLNYWL